MNLEHALGKIHSRRHSPEVQLTLDVLKAGKRFHATVSFDADTGEQSLTLYSLHSTHIQVSVYMCMCVAVHLAVLYITLVYCVLCQV